MQTPGSRETFRFGDFELDVAAYELRRQGRPVKLGRQPMDLLILLVERRRQLVSRSEIVDRLWGKDVFVDVETGVNTAISKVRQALRDSPDAPAFVETVPGQGLSLHRGGRERSPRLHQSAAGVRHPEPSLARTVEMPAQQAPDSTISAPAVPSSQRPSGASRRPRLRSGLGVGLLVLSVVVGVLASRDSRAETSARGVTLAVLPFENLGSDPEREYLAAGLTEETSASLAQIDPEHLSVKGRTLRYKGTTKTAAEIGQELAVDYLVESTIRAEGGRLRVTVTLIRVRDQEHVWSQSYEREPTSLLGLQQELSTAIAEQIRSGCRPIGMSGLGRRQTRNADAYDAYLRGRYQGNRRTPDGNARAIEVYQRAIAIDPNYALAWSDLAFAYAAVRINGDARPADVGPLARDAAAHAVARQPGPRRVADWPSGTTTGCSTGTGRPRRRRSDCAIRARSQQRGGASDPGPRALAIRPARAKRRRRCAARASSTRLDAAEPRAVGTSRVPGPRLSRAAVEHARRAVSLDSEFWIGYMELGQAYERRRETTTSRSKRSRTRRGSRGGNSKAISLRGYILARSGRTDGGARSAEKAGSRRRASGTCRRMRWRSCTRVSGSARRCSTGSTRPTPRATSTSYICPSIRSGIRTGPIPVSSIWLPAVGLGLPTDGSRREFSCGPDPSAVATSTAAPAGRRRCPAPSAPHVSRPDRTDSPVAFD